MNPKIQLIQCLLGELPPAFATTVDEARREWFHSPREGGGLRLSDRGFAVLNTVVGLEFYEFLIEDPLTVNTRVLIDLERKLKTPYYIFMKNRRIHSVAFFGDREAISVQMYGDLVRFLELYS